MLLLVVLPPSPRLGEVHPRTVVLGCVEFLHLSPGAQRLFPRSAFFGSEEIAHEVDVSPMGDLRKGLDGLVQANVFPDEVSVGESQTLDDLRFSPAIEPIACARLPLQTRNKLLSFSFDEVPGRLVVPVDRHGKVEVPHSRKRLGTSPTVLAVIGELTTGKGKLPR